MPNLCLLNALLHRQPIQTSRKVHLATFVDHMTILTHLKNQPLKIMLKYILKTYKRLLIKLLNVSVDGNTSIA